MHNFKKALSTTTALILAFLITFAAIIAPCFDADSQCSDAKLRRDLSGKIDYIFSGASHTFQAVDPSVIDKELGVCSYNMSSPSASMDGRYTLLEKEVYRNNLDTVVIDISFDGLTRSAASENAVGEPMIACRLDSLSESIGYLADHTSFFNNDVENVISIFMRYGLKAWKDKLTGQTGVLQRNKGFWPIPAIDVRLKTEEIVETYNTEQGHIVFSEENIEQLEKMIRLCHENNIRVMVVVIPLSDAFLWQHSNMDGFLAELKLLCEKNNCPVYDFNLLRNRYEIFSDQDAFCNLTHMSESGAASFSKAFCDLVKELDVNANVDNLFYGSYDELKQSSPYMYIYKEYHHIAF